jgi:cytoskeletal protein CcmA (bactofilin family)
VSYFSASKNERDVKAAKPSAPEPKLAIAPAPVSITATRPRDIVSTFGHGMVITGNVISTGALQIFGQVTGDVHAAQVTICEGARVEGKVVAQETVVQGTFKGVIHGNTVRLASSAVVDGEVFNRVLTIEENALFEGVSRRLEAPISPPSLEQQTEAAPQPIAAMAPIAPAFEPV